MKQKSKGGKLLSILSALYLLAALCLLLKVCGTCMPETEEWLRHVFLGEETGSVREAFGALADGLAEGENLKTLILETADELLNHAD